MNRVIETRRHGPLDELLARRKLEVIVGFPAVCAPVPFVCARVGVKDNHPTVKVTISHKKFVRLTVDEQTGRASEVLRIVTALILSGMADLKNELSLVRKLENLVVLFRVSAQPHIILIVDENPVPRGRPLVVFRRSRLRAAPGLEELAIRIELEDRRRRNTAFGLRRIERRSLFSVRDCGGPVEYPEIVVAVDRET